MRRIGEYRTVHFLRHAIWRGWRAAFAPGAVPLASAAAGHLQPGAGLDPASESGQRSQKLAANRAPESVDVVAAIADGSGYPNLQKSKTPIFSARKPESDGPAVRSVFTNLLASARRVNDAPVTIETQSGAAPPSDRENVLLEIVDY